MLNKDNIINGYKVLADKLDEVYLDLTLRQLNELDVILAQAWGVVERRQVDRRAK